MHWESSPTRRRADRRGQLVQDGPDVGRMAHIAVWAAGNDGLAALQAGCARSAKRKRWRRWPTRRGDHSPGRTPPRGDLGGHRQAARPAMTLVEPGDDVSYQLHQARVLIMAVSQGLAPLRGPRRSASRAGLMRRMTMAVPAIQTNITARAAQAGHQSIRPADQKRATPMPASPRISRMT